MEQKASSSEGGENQSHPKAFRLTSQDNWDHSWLSSPSHTPQVCAANWQVKTTQAVAQLLASVTQNGDCLHGVLLLPYSKKEAPPGCHFALQSALRRQHEPNALADTVLRHLPRHFWPLSN